MGGLVKTQKKVLWTVLIINLVMFLTEMGMGLWGNSQALIADSLDMLGDMLAYWSTLFVLTMGVTAKIRSSQFKAIIMLVFALAVFARVIYKFIHVSVPSSEIMGGMGFVALAANAYCLYLLSRHKNDDINFRSVWICSRNDIIANSAVILGAGLVFIFQSPWPDLVIGAGITMLFCQSAYGIFKESFKLKQEVTAQV